jgi:hypothetical protein
VLQQPLRTLSVLMEEKVLEHKFELVTVARISRGGVSVVSRSCYLTANFTTDCVTNPTHQYTEAT